MRKYGKSQDYGVERLADGVYKLDEFGISNCFLIVGREKALLVDAGIGVGDLLGAVRKLTDLPVELLATHAHPDHIGGRGQFDRIYIHKNEKNSILKIANANIFRKLLTVMCRMVNGEKMKAAGITVKDVNKYEKKTENVFVDDETVFDLGGKTIEIRNFSGHTAGSVVILLKEDKIMLTGDNVNPNLWMFLPCSPSVEGWLDGAKKIRELSKEYTPYYSHDDGAQSFESMTKVIENAEALMKKYKKNTFFPRITVFSIFDKSKLNIVARTSNIFK